MNFPYLYLSVHLLLIAPGKLLTILKFVSNFIKEREVGIRELKVKFWIIGFLVLRGKRETQGTGGRGEPSHDVCCRMKAACFIT